MGANISTRFAKQLWCTADADTQCVASPRDAGVGQRSGTKEAVDGVRSVGNPPGMGMQSCMLILCWRDRYEAGKDSSHTKTRAASNKQTKEIKVLRRTKREQEKHITALLNSNSILKDKVKVLQEDLHSATASVATQSKHIGTITSRYGKLAAAMASIDDFGGGAGRASAGGSRLLSTDQIFKYSIASLTQDKVRMPANWGVHR